MSAGLERMGVSMNRSLNTMLAISALTLTGCFNNLSGLDSKSSTVSSQSNGGQLNDSGFSNETGPINTNAVLIGAYRDTTTPSDIGILIDLQKSLIATLGAPAVQSILDTIDTNTSMQNRQVIIHVLGFSIKATTTLGAIAAGNEKKLRNIMNIRPRLVRVDLTTSSLEVPTYPSVLQLKNSNKTVLTYGGKIEGDFVRRMMVMIPYPGANGIFWPNSSTAQNYGDGYPSFAPEETTGSVRLLPVSLDIANHFSDRMNAPQDQSRFSSVPESIRNISSNYQSFAFAVHLQMLNGSPVIYPMGHVYAGLPKIDAAYIININPGNPAGPDIFPFCLASYDNQDLVMAWNNIDIDYTHPLACNCDPALQSCQAQPSSGITLPPASIFKDTWPTVSLAPTKQKAKLIQTLMQNSTPPPVSPILVLTPVTLSNFVISQE